MTDDEPLFLALRGNETERILWPQQVWAKNFLGLWTDEDDPLMVPIFRFVMLRDVDPHRAGRIDVARPHGADFSGACSDEAVEADRGRVALQRGPLVYALEGADHPDGRVRNLVLADESVLQTEHREHLLGGVVVITGPGRALAYDSRDRVTRKEVTLTAIPYYAWANREPGEMAVWIPRTETLMEPAR